MSAPLSSRPGTGPRSAAAAAATVPGTCGTTDGRQPRANIRATYTRGRPPHVLAFFFCLSISHIFLVNKPSMSCISKESLNDYNPSRFTKTIREPVMSIYALEISAGLNTRFKPCWCLYMTLKSLNLTIIFKF